MQEWKRGKCIKAELREIIFILDTLRPCENRQFLLNAKPRPRTSTKSKEEYKEEARQDSTKSSDEDLEPHPDERQVGLDTDRSFVVYPVGDCSVMCL